LPLSRHLPDLLGLTFVLLVQAAAGLYLMRGQDPQRKTLILQGLAWSGVLLAAGFLLRFHVIAEFLPIGLASWGQGLAVLWAFVSIPLIGAVLLWSFVSANRDSHSPQRRAFLTMAKTALFGVPVAATGYGVFVQRFQLGLREQNIGFPNLPKDLDGLRLAQLTDIHLGPFLSARDLARAVDMANETRADVALVTGDLITSAGDPLDDCIRELARLRAPGGVLGCLGNHEIYADAEDYTEQQSALRGVKFLRKRATQLRFGGASLNIAGVDYARSKRRYLTGAERLIVPGAFNLLLSHNPDVFPVAARKGFDLTLAGHTHGGQVRVEILHQDLNVARFFTPYVDGLYTRDASAIFVSRGIGTIGMPARLGAPPEVALIRLCRS
jgi:uncharacterized protein